MVKVKVYRTIGYIFAVLGIVGYIVNVCQPHKFKQFIANPSAELLPAVFGILGALALNIFLWAGLLALWKADKIENPEKKSKWLKIIKPYAIFTVIMVAIMVLLGLLRRR